MGAILFYVLKSSIYLFVFVLLYVWLLRGSTFFRFNRCVFWLGTFLCMALPFVTFTVDEPSVVQQTLLSVGESLTEIPAASTGASSPVYYSISPSDEQQGTISLALLNYLPMIYSLGSIIVLFFFSFSFFRLWKLVRKTTYTQEEGFRLILLHRPMHPFSWWRYIVLSEEDYCLNGETILKHEKMHLRYHHTIDLLWMQCLLVVHWFNPMAWVLWRELQELHEYEADEGVITSGVSARQYQMLLVKKAVGTRLYSMANGFNHSKLKNRISMMLKKRSNGWVRLRVLLAVPVVAGVMYAFAQPEMSEVMSQITPTVSQTTADDDLESLVKFFNRCDSLYWDTQKRPDGSVIVRESQGNKLYVNAENFIMFDNTVYKTSAKDMAPIMTEHLRKKRIADKDFPQFIYMIYDVKSDKQFITDLLRSVKSAYDNLRAEYTAQGVKNLDEVCPYATRVEKPRKYGEDGIKVSISSADGKQTEQVYKFGKNLKHYQLKYGKKAIVALIADNSAFDHSINNIQYQLKKYFDHVDITREK